MTAAAANDALIALFEREGYARVEPPVLQPADVFIDLSGEDIRRRMFVTQDAAGRELCLRPEYTIPVCLQHLDRVGAQPAELQLWRPGVPAAHRRERRVPPGGHRVRSAAATLPRRMPRSSALALEGLDALGAPPPRVKLGDMGLLETLLDALGIAPAAKRRVMRAIVSGQRARRPRRARTDRASASMPASSPPSRARRRRRPRPSSRTSSPSPASRASAAAAPARSPSAFSPGPRTARASARRGARRCSTATSPSPAIRTPRRQRSGALARDAGLDIEPRHRRRSRSAPASWRRAGLDVARLPLRRRLRAQSRLLYRLHLRGARSAPHRRQARRRRRPLRPAAAAPRRRPNPIPAVGCSFWLDRIVGIGADERRFASHPGGALEGPPAGERRRVLRPRRARLLAMPRGPRLSRRARGRARRRGAFLSASEIVEASWPAARPISASPARTWSARASPMPTRAVELLTPLGFGHANVVVAVPQAWIDVRTMADLDEVAADLRARHGTQDAGRDEIREPDPPLLRRAAASPTTASSRASARPKARPARAPPSSSSTSPRPARRSPPMP